MIRSTLVSYSEEVHLCVSFRPTDQKPKERARWGWHEQTYSHQCQIRHPRVKCPGVNMILDSVKACARGCGPYIQEVQTRTVWFWRDGEGVAKH